MIPRSFGDAIPGLLMLILIGIIVGVWLGIGLIG
jgi:hypothetical protein